MKATAIAIALLDFVLWLTFALFRSYTNKQTVASNICGELQMLIGGPPVVAIRQISLWCEN